MRHRDILTLERLKLSREVIQKELETEQQRLLQTQTPSSAQFRILSYKFDVVNTQLRKFELRFERANERAKQNSYLASQNANNNYWTEHDIRKKNLDESNKILFEIEQQLANMRTNIGNVSIDMSELLELGRAYTKEKNRNATLKRAMQFWLFRKPATIHANIPDGKKLERVREKIHNLELDNTGVINPENMDQAADFGFKLNTGEDLSTLSDVNSLVIPEPKVYQNRFEEDSVMNTILKAALTKKDIVEDYKEFKPLKINTESGIDLLRMKPPTETINTDESESSE